MVTTNKKNTFELSINGAKHHNLKDLFIEISNNALVTVTGLSGSGKSSLAFATVYGEGQRRYIETFSPYVRQFFDKINFLNYYYNYCIEFLFKFKQKFAFLWEI